MVMNILLKCRNIEETRNFYSTILDFAVGDSAEGTVSAELAGGTLIFSTGENLGTAPVMSGTIYFFVSDVDGYYESVYSRVEIAWPLQEMSYGLREFGIKDCNGYYLAFAQDRDGQR